MDESLLGSQPMIMTFLPPSAQAAAMFEAVLDFPIPPFPYIAMIFCFFKESSS
jgi:hypothetical protein